MAAFFWSWQYLPFEFADASMAVRAEHSGLTNLLTTDRDFDVYLVARGKRLKNLLGPALTRRR